MKRLTKKQEEIIAQIHKFVKKECIGFASDDVFKNHILEVKNFAEKLAKAYDANTFVVIIAAYLHDIYYIQTRDHSIHEIKGSEFSKKYLKKFYIPEKDIELIAKCILNHRGSKKRKRDSIEEKIIACADAMDHLNRFEHMFYRRSQDMEYEDAMEWMRGKMSRGWNKLELKKAKDMIRPRYEAAKIAFDI